MIIKPQVVVAGEKDYLIQSTRRPIVSKGSHLDGFCSFQKNKMYVAEDQWGIDAVETVIHEFRHGQQPYICEDYIRFLAKEEAVMLNQLGLLKLPTKPWGYGWRPS